MRVIAGTARSIPLKTIKGLATRPTQDRIKETLFNVIQSGVEGCVFVDLYSGSGAIGIEALSRGAKKVYFMERSEKACECIRQNLALTKLTEGSVVKRLDVLAGLHTIEEKEVDYIHLDPPYGEGLEESVLASLGAMSYVSSSTTVVIETSLPTTYEYANSCGFEVFKEKKYKTNKHVFLRKL